MDSSTSHSSSDRSRALGANSVPWWAVKLLGVAVSTWAVAALYTLQGNPEIAFYRRADVLKREWSRAIGPGQTSRIVVLGGSSCLTAIVPRRMLEQYQLPTLNLGLVAGMGAQILTRYGLDFVKPGDTLIVALEPGLLVRPPELEPLGVQFAVATGQTRLLSDGRRVDWVGALVSLRPGGYHVFTLLGKIILRQPLYRYAPSELKEGGWLEVAARRDLGNPGVGKLKLSPEGKELLATIHRECQRRGVRVAYSLPWQFCVPEDLTATQRENLLFIREVAAVIPVLREPSLGAHAVREHFADTLLHPIGTAAALRTDELAQAITSWSLWSPDQPSNR